MHGMPLMMQFLFSEHCWKCKAIRRKSSSQCVEYRVHQAPGASTSSQVTSCCNFIMHSPVLAIEVGTGFIPLFSLYQFKQAHKSWFLNVKLMEAEVWILTCKSNRICSLWFSYRTLLSEMLTSNNRILHHVQELVNEVVRHTWEHFCFVTITYCGSVWKSFQYWDVAHG